jgi:CubicO group peptidase (beta-lactamase class C family)
MSRCTRRIGVLLWVAIGMGPSSTSFAAAPPKWFERLSEDFGQTGELLQVPGLAAAVVQDGRLVWHLQRVVDLGSNEDGALDTARALLTQLRDG